MPIVTVAHRTTYIYRYPVMLGPHQLMLRPRESRNLRLISHEIDILPQADLAWSQDVADNPVASAMFQSPTDRLTISSQAKVELSAPMWPIFPISANAAAYPFRYSDDEWTDLGALTRQQFQDDECQFSTWVEGFVRQRPTDTLSLLKDINAGIPAQIFYESRDSEGTQSPLQTLHRGRGSCRDFAVLLAESARVLGLGARLVSGYLFDPGSDMVGSTDAGSTHAWVEIYIPGAGWITFDPTNQSMGASHLIPVAVVRDIRQAVPVAGSFSGSPDALVDMTVEVRVSASG
ncbi:transglutaminase family protein [Paracoccus actinidiae]|uniref:transglutaminase family protein n=1 Tax=Paracoccus actinidiae TaxID=3064531 RepID=UPI0027D2534E|nr:transglutaminase family protein [Paracoccus sp. M09]